jgi:hypothetical protein
MKLIVEQLGHSIGCWGLRASVGCGAEMGNCYLKKESITNYITNCFFTK